VLYQGLTQFHRDMIMVNNRSTLTKDVYSREPGEKGVNFIWSFKKNAIKIFAILNYIQNELIT